MPNDWGYLMNNNNESGVTTNEVYSPKAFLFIKRFIDILGAIVGAVFALIIIFFVKIAFFVTGDKDKLMFKQTRIGKNGKPIQIHKIRSMVVDADEVLEKLLKEDKQRAEEYRIYKKLKDDPRITKVGRVIRRYSIDELPQFFDVLAGRLSLVGPRPYLLKEKDEMGEYYDTIIKVKPGITGFWQVNGRSNTDFETRLKMDKYYCRTRNLALDFGIIFKTFYKVFKKEGAE